MSVAHVVLAYPTKGWNCPNVYPLLVTQAMLGSWDKYGPHASAGPSHPSRLIQGVSIRKICDSITAFNTQYSDAGLFGLYAVAGPYGLRDLVTKIGEELSYLAHVIDEERLEEAKDLATLSILSHTDSSWTVCEAIGREVTSHGRRIHPLEAIARIQAVDAKAIKNLAAETWYDRDHALAAIGPIHELPDYNRSRRKSYMARF